MFKKALAIFLVLCQIFTSSAIVTFAQSVKENQDTLSETFLQSDVEYEEVYDEVEEDILSNDLNDVSHDSVEEIDEETVFDLVEEEESLNQEEETTSYEEEIIDDELDNFDKEDDNINNDYDSENNESESLEDSSRFDVEDKENEDKQEESDVEESSLDDVVEDKNLVETSATEEEVSKVAEATISEIDEIIVEDGVLYGENKVTLTYNFNDKENGGVGSTDVWLFGNDKKVWTKEVQVGKPYGKFEEFYRPGYILSGYSFSRNGDIIKEDDIVEITGNTTIYAIWEPEKYKLRIAKNIMINGVESDGKSHIEFAFDEDIIETIESNGLRAVTADDNKDYDCLEFLGWSFNEEYYDFVKESDKGKEEAKFTNHNIKIGRAEEATLCAVYNIKYVHVTLNANEGFYDGEKILDLGLVPCGQRLNEAVGSKASYREPTPPKDMRLEKWWVPYYLDEPQTPDYKYLTVGTSINILDFDVEKLKYIWNEEYKAHYEEDRYYVTFWGGASFHIAVGDQSEKWFETGVWNDDPNKFNFKNRLGEDKVFNYSGDIGGYSPNKRTLYVLKGKNLKEAMDELGYELPTAWDRDLIGWQEGEKKHPDRVEQKYINEDGSPFEPINDFSKYTVNGPMHFTAVWKVKPLILVFKEGELENAKFASGRTEQTVAFEARDAYVPGGVIPETYKGSLYNRAQNVNKKDEPLYPGYEDIDVKDKENWEFLRWEDEHEFIKDKIVLDATVRNPETGEITGWDGVKYVGLEDLWISLDYIPEPIVFHPVVDKIQIPVNMYSPFPVFPQGKKRRSFAVGSGTKLGEVDDYINATFETAEKEGYHFVGWYMIDHKKINNTDRTNISVEDIECMMETGRPTVTGITEPGLDTWFKYVQSTVIDDTEMALGQYLTKIDGEVLLNNKLNKDYGGLDILALYTSNLTLNAGDGYFENPTSIEYEDESAKDVLNEEGKIIQKTIKGLLPMIDNEPISSYIAAGYEVPKSNDPNKKFAGWRLSDINGRVFSEYEAISKDTYLVATYIEKTDTIKLTIDLHGAEKTIIEKDESGNTTTKVVPMEPIVMELPQGTLMEEVEMPVVKRKGYKYWQAETLVPAWYHTYNEEDGSYENPVMTKDVLDKDTTIHLRWTPVRYSYDFIYEIDGVKKGYKNVVGEYGEKIEDCEFYKIDSAIAKMFDFSLENQPEKGYKITSVRMYNETGREVFKDSIIEGNVRCKLIVEPIETTITFDANGGELLGEEVLKVPFGTKFKDIVGVPKVSKEEVSFVGFVDDNGEKITENYRIKEKTNKFTAMWTDTNITVILDAGNGKFTNGSKKLVFENIPIGQVLQNMTFGDLKYEEPTLDGKVFDKWELDLKEQMDIEWTKENEVGKNIHDIKKEAKDGLVLKASYVDKTVTFTIKLTDISSRTGYMTFANLPYITTRTMLHTEPIKRAFGTRAGVDWEYTVKEGMTFNQWFDHIYDEGYRYRVENGFLLCGWKYEEPATEKAPRKQTKDMADVDMNAPIKDGDVFTPFLSKGYFGVTIYANGGTYDKVEPMRNLENGVRAYQYDDDNTQMSYWNVPAGTRADRIDPSVMPKRAGYTLVGYSRIDDEASGKSLAQNPFVGGTENFYAIWSENKNQYVQTPIHRGSNSRSVIGNPTLQNANDKRTGIVTGLGPQSALPADAQKQFTQKVSEETKKQSEQQVNQILQVIGLSGEAINNSQVKQAAYEIQAGINIKEQYDKISNQIKQNPSITEQITKISDVKITNNQAHWHTDANGNVTLESFDHFFYDKEKGRYSHNIVDAWQPITNETGQTGWYKFDKNGYMQTGLVQDGQHTYYLSEEKGAGYGQMICNQTINIGGLKMTFNAQGALVDMQYDVQHAVKTLQNAASGQQQLVSQGQTSNNGQALPMPLSASQQMSQPLWGAQQVTQTSNPVTQASNPLPQISQSMPLPLPLPMTSQAMPIL